MLPIYFFYLAGVAEEADIRRSRLLVNSIAFVMGFTFIFVMLGATATTLGGFLKDNIDTFRKISGIIMVIMGLKFIGIIKLNLLNVDRHFNFDSRQLNFVKSIVFGMVFAFGWTPCVGVFLGSALLLAGSADSIAQGIFLLLLYSIGLGLPFILSAILFDAVKQVLRGMQKYSRMISIVSGLVLIAAGLCLFMGNIGYLVFL
jgi:cytochrome c-type biogenesis protein